MLTAGSVIGGIRIDAMLGKGAMGEVYRGQQISLKRPVAVKRIAGHLLGDDAARARFAREAQCVARIQSPYVVAVHDFATVTDDAGEEHTLLVMELVDGGASLRSLLTAHGGPFDWRTASAVILHVAEGLAAAAEFGVVHRDIKPDNIMVTRKGIAKLADFGLAKSVDSSAMTIAGTVMGTPLYLPPEACRGQQVDARGDLYSLGCTWFHLLTGRPPFLAENTVALLRAHLDDMPPDLRTLAPHVPGGIADIVHRLLAKHPDERFQSAEALAEAIHGLDGISIPRSVPHIFGADTATAITQVADSEQVGSSPTAATVLAKEPAQESATIPMTAIAQPHTSNPTTAATARTAATFPFPKDTVVSENKLAPINKKSGLAGLLIGIAGIAVLLIAILIYVQILTSGNAVRAAAMQAVKSGDIGLALQQAGSHLAANPRDPEAVSLVRDVVAAETAHLISNQRLDDAKRRLDEHRATWNWLDTGLLERDVALAQAKWLASHNKEKEAVAQFRTLRDQGVDPTLINQAMVDSLIESNRPAEAIYAAYQLAESANGPLQPNVLKLLTYALEFEGPFGEFIEKLRTVLLTKHPAIVETVRPWITGDDYEKRYNAYFILLAANQISDAEQIQFQFYSMMTYSSSYNAGKEATTWLQNESMKPDWPARKKAAHLPAITKPKALDSWSDHATAVIAVLSSAFVEEVTDPAITWLNDEDENFRWNAFLILQNAKQLEKIDVPAFHAKTLTTFNPLYDSAPFNQALTYFVAMKEINQIDIARQALVAAKKHVENEIAEYEKSNINSKGLYVANCQKRLDQIIAAQKALEFP